MSARLELRPGMVIKHQLKLDYFRIVPFGQERQDCVDFLGEDLNFFKSWKKVT